MEVGRTVLYTLASPYTYLISSADHTYPRFACGGDVYSVGSRRVRGVIYLCSLRVKADAASFDRGMLSVSWSAQFSVFSFNLALYTYIFSLSTLCDRVQV